MAAKYFILLGINDHGAVYSKVRAISANWKPFASSLCLSPNTINLIDANNNKIYLLLCVYCCIIELRSHLLYMYLQNKKSNLFFKLYYLLYLHIIAYYSTDRH